MRNLILFFLILFLPLICYGQIHLGLGQTYPNIESAFTAGAIQPGDTVFLHSGSYYGYQGISKLKGTETKWIVITRFEKDPIDIAGCWQFMSCEYIKFLNLNFKANTKYPGRLFSVDNSGSCETQSKFIIVDSCVFSNTSDSNAIAAFKFGGVDKFEVTNCVFKEILACSTMDYNVCHDGIIHDNKFENCLTGGHIKGGASDITMERNIFINASQANWVAFELGGDTGAQFYCPDDKYEVKNLKFFSNIIIGGYRGLALSSAVDCQVINNTFYNCGQATMRFLTTSSLYPILSGNRVENNIFAFGTSAYFNGGVQPFGAVTFGNNIYYSLINTDFNGPYWDTPDLDSIRDPNPMNYSLGTTMFIDGPNNDFNLAKGSPAIGAGMTETEPTTDFYGKPFSLTARSIGAIEFKSDAGIGETISAEIEISPNPASDYIYVRNKHSCSQQEIKIFNIFGVLVMTIETGLRPVSTKIDISLLPARVYFCKINFDNKFELIKFVKIN